MNSPSPSSPTPTPRFLISRHRRLAWIGSGIACLLSVLGLVLCWLDPTIAAPLKPGLDFTGGTQIQVERRCAPPAAAAGAGAGAAAGSGAASGPGSGSGPSGGGCEPIPLPVLQKELAELTLPVESGQSPPNLDNANAQVLDNGRSLLLRLPELTNPQSERVVALLRQRIGPLVDPPSESTIGPSLGSRLLQGSLVSLLVSFAAIAVYISFRYSGVYAFLALLCLAHDVLITCGLFAWLGLLRGIEVDSLFAVSLITVAGYSVTDTVVVFDRIREQRRELGHLPVVEQVDVAVDATLTRSLYTSFTTLLPLLALMFFGGASLYWFSVALAVGIAVGSWSSIGIAPTLLPLLVRR